MATAPSVSPNDLRAALDARQFHLAYQPKVECSTNRVRAFEALARWTHPVLGDLPPKVFIPVAERSGLIRELTLQVMETGLCWFRSLQHEEELFLCINLSVSALEDLQFLQDASTVCETCGVSPENVIFELNEIRGLPESPRALEFVTRLRLNGFNVAIDDVGSGYSSLERLSNLPFSQMKIDKTILFRTHSSPKMRAVLENLIAMGHSLGLAVVAEGVEDEEGMKLVTGLGCDLAQGNHIAAPMSDGDARQWYAERITH